MSTNRFSLFSGARYIKIEPEKFMNAIINGDSAAIDSMLELKKHGSELNINGTYHTGNPLRELLIRRDFENAKKLLQAGADKEYYTKEYFGDSWGEWEIKRHDLLDEFSGQEDVMEFLRNDTRRNSFEKIKKEYENAKQLLETYQTMMQEMTNSVKQEPASSGFSMNKV